MVDKNANIDLLFRNGLKDLEVLPPADMWDGIRPVVRKRQMPFIILRNAAAVALLMSLSFLGYKWSSNSNIASRENYLAVEDEQIRPSDLVSGNLNTSGIVTKKVQPADEKRVTETDDGRLVTENQQESITPATLVNVRDTRSVSFTRGVPSLIGLTGRGERSAFVPEENPAYLPGNLIDFDYVEPKEKTNRWSIAAMASPTYYPGPQMGNDELARQIMASEQSQISYSGGVAFAYNISKKLSIQSGIYYSSVGQEVGGISSFTGFRQYDLTKGDHNFEVLTSSGTILTNNSDVFLLDGAGDRVITRDTRDVFDPAKASLPYMNNSLHQSFSYLEMPVILRYKLIDRGIDFNVIGGLSYNMLVNNNVYTISNGSKYQVGETDGLNPFMVSSSLGMGMEYNLSDKFSLNFEPTFRYYLNQIGRAHV